MKIIALAALTASAALATPATAGVYLNVEANSSLTGNDYTSTTTDIHVGYEGGNDSASRNWTDKFSLTPFYRFYFFNKRDYGGAGFFAAIFTDEQTPRFSLDKVYSIFFLFK